MATIVNARDVYLQAYSPRIEEVTMQDNISVDVDQVEGLGIVIAGTKTIRVTADTQVFQIPKTGSVSPSSVTLTVVKTNITTAATLSVIAGTVSPTPVLSGNTVTIPYDDFDTDTVTFRVSVTEDTITYSDDITVIKVREGEDSFNAFLTNESHTLPADSAGNVLSYSGCSGNFKVYRGSYDVTSACTFALATGGNPDGLVYSINTSGAYSVSGGMPTAVDVTTLTFTATFGSVILAKTLSISKANAGDSGNRGSRTFYVPVAVTTFDSGLATTTASEDGGPVLRDVVTQYNSSVEWSETRFYDGAVWVVVNAVVDGNLLVTGSVAAEKLAADSVTADKIDVANLEAVSASMGNLSVDGTLTVGSGGKIESSDFVDGTTGFQIVGGSSSTIKINNGRIGNAVINQYGIESNGYSSTYGWKLDNGAGKIYARDIEIKNAASTRIFDLSAIGVAPVLKVDNVMSILADGTMTVTALNVINTDQIVDGAVTTIEAASSAAQTISTSAEEDIVSVSVDSSGKPVLVQASADIIVQDTSSTGTTLAIVRIYAGTTLLQQRISPVASDVGTRYSMAVPIKVGSPGTGSVTYKITLQLAGVGTISVGAGYVGIVATALKK